MLSQSVDWSLVVPPCGEEPISEQRSLLMPPMYINTGANVDDETMVDSHALVGSCAQIGKRVVRLVEYSSLLVPCR